MSHSGVLPAWFLVGACTFPTCHHARQQFVPTPAKGKTEQGSVGAALHNPEEHPNASTTKKSFRKKATISAMIDK